MYSNIRQLVSVYRSFIAVSSHSCAFLPKHTFSSVSGDPCRPTPSSTICAQTQISPHSWILTMAVQLFNATRLCIQDSFTQYQTQMTTSSGIMTPEGTSRRWSTAPTREMDNETEEFIPLHTWEHNFQVQKKCNQVSRRLMTRAP